MGLFKRAKKPFRMDEPRYRGVDNIFDTEFDRWTHRKPHVADCDENGFDRNLEGYEEIRREVELSRKFTMDPRDLANSTKEFFFTEIRSDSRFSHGLFTSPSMGVWSSEAFFLGGSSKAGDLHVFALKSLDGPMGEYTAYGDGDVKLNGQGFHSAEVEIEEVEALGAALQAALDKQSPMERQYQRVHLHVLLIHYGAGSTYTSLNDGFSGPTVTMAPADYNLPNVLFEQCGEKITDTLDHRLVGAVIDFTASH